MDRGASLSTAARLVRRISLASVTAPSPVNHWGATSVNPGEAAPRREKRGNAGNQARAARDSRHDLRLQVADSLQLAAGASVSAAFFHYLAGALALAGMVAVAG